ncbi:MAG TPA: hypothetical protein DD706_09315 [Nitrospiraceae bacterium]|nr:hypothetical protein [Nitrospiraceae bacterium]
MTITSHRMPILVIDDSPEDSPSIQGWLRQPGFSNPLVHCSVGEDALSLLDQKTNPETGAASKLNPGCILLSLNLPDLDGRDIWQSIKPQLKLNLLPVHVLSSSNDPEDTSPLPPGTAKTPYGETTQFRWLSPIHGAIQKLLGGNCRTLNIGQQTSQAMNHSPIIKGQPNVSRVFSKTIHPSNRGQPGRCRSHSSQFSKIRTP